MRDCLSHNYYDIYRLEFVVKGSASPELPNLCYRIVRFNCNAFHVWFNGPRAGLARLCRFRDELVGSFGTAAASIMAILAIMCGSPVQNLGATVTSPTVRANIDKLSNLQQYYAAPQAGNLEASTRKPAPCMFVCMDPKNSSIECHFDPIARYRLRQSIHAGPVGGTPPVLGQYVPNLDDFDWNHEYFDCEVKWKGDPREDWLGSLSPKLTRKHPQASRGD